MNDFWSAFFEYGSKLLLQDRVFPVGDTSVVTAVDTVIDFAAIAGGAIDASRFLARDFREVKHGHFVGGGE